MLEDGSSGNPSFLTPSSSRFPSSLFLSSSPPPSSSSSSSSSSSFLFWPTVPPSLGTPPWPAARPTRSAIFFSHPFILLGSASPLFCFVSSFFFCVFSHSFTISYNLFDEIPPLSIYKWMNLGTILNHIFEFDLG